MYSHSEMTRSSVKMRPDLDRLLIYPTRERRPEVIRPRRLRGAAAMRAQAAARAREAGRVRRSSIAWMIRAGIGTSVALFPIGLLAMGNPQTFSGGTLSATALRVVVFGGFTGAIALAALTGIIAAIREDVALSRLQRAAR